MNPRRWTVRGLNEINYQERENNMATYETALFLTAGIVSGIGPLVLVHIQRWKQDGYSSGHRQATGRNGLPLTCWLCPFAQDRCC